MTGRSIRIALVNYGGDFSAEANAEQALSGIRTLAHWASAVQGAGAEVKVFQGFHRDDHAHLEGIDYRLIAGRFSPRLPRRHIPWRLHRAVSRWRPDVVHLNGLLYGIQARWLSFSLPAASALVLQHHGEPPDRGFIRRLQRWGLGAADGFFFTARGLAAPWRDSRLLRDSQPIFEILEGSSRLQLMERSAARAISGLKGDPIFLWAANLDANKDPLTILDGFEAALPELPKARLYMAWRLGSLLPEVRQRIAASDLLQQHVELLGTIPYAEIQPLFNSADFLLQGSQRESCGFAVADALACGSIPIVTDIPTFRVLTREGTLGKLWPHGDAGALREALLATARDPERPSRRAIRHGFDAHLSFEAIGQQALAAYVQLSSSRTFPRR